MRVEVAKLVKVKGRETLCQYDGGLQSLPDNTSVARIDLPSEEEYYGNWRFPYL